MKWRFGSIGRTAIGPWSNGHGIIGRRCANREPCERIRTPCTSEAPNRFKGWLGAHSLGRQFIMESLLIQQAVDFS